MKFTVTVDVSDLYAEEEGESFSDGIKSAITHEVKMAVLADWRNKIGSDVDKEIIRAVEGLRDGFLAATIRTLMDEPGVKKSVYGSEMVSLKEYAKGVLERDFGERNIADVVGKVVRELGDKMSKEMKDRYDMLFASQLVAKMHENKMLRDDVASLLLSADAK